MKTVAMFLLLISTTSAFAYKDGNYSCKNEDGVPNNTYKVKTVALPGLTEGVPYVEISRFYKLESGNYMAAVMENKISGFPVKITTPGGSEILQLAAVSLEFEDQRLLNCKP